MSHAFSKQVVADVIHPIIDDVLHGGRADVISLGFVISVWAGSSAMATFVNTITIAYDMRDMRGAVKSRLLALCAASSARFCSAWCCCRCWCSARTY